MTYAQLLQHNTIPKETLRLLLLHMKQWSFTEYVMHLEEPVDALFLASFRGNVERLKKNEPVQYILGEADFYGRSFTVCPGVLIPRYDTEILVETMLKEEKPESKRVLDLCTGSGCIAVTLQLENAKWQVEGTDISEEALAVAEENGKRYNVPVRFYQSDLFSFVDGTYEVIVSNPPYIPSAVIDTLDPEVKKFEPHLALDGGADGLFFYRQIAKDIPRYLTNGGRLYLEIGDEEGEAVSRILQEQGFTDIQIIPDLSGRDRVVKACLKK